MAYISGNEWVLPRNYIHTDGCLSSEEEQPYLAIGNFALGLRVQPV